MATDQQLERFFNKLDERLDELHKRVSHIDKTLGRQEEQMIERTRRTTMLEEKLDPIANHVAMVQGGLKVIGILTALSGLAAVAKRIFHP